MYAEYVAAAVAAQLTTDELSELAGIDSEAKVELARLKDEVVVRLAGMARRSRASSAYLTRPPDARSDARSA